MEERLREMFMSNFGMKCPSDKLLKSINEEEIRPFYQIKKVDREQSLPNGPETSGEHKLYIKFSDVSSYYGKTTVRITNGFENHKILGKETFDFAKQHDEQKEKCCFS